MTPGLAAEALRAARADRMPCKPFTDAIVTRIDPSLGTSGEAVSTFEHTAREAADRGYEVTVVSDATSSLSEEQQRAALGYALTNVATIATTADMVTSFLDQPEGWASER